VHEWANFSTLCLCLDTLDTLETLYLDTLDALDTLDTLDRLYLDTLDTLYLNTLDTLYLDTGQTGHTVSGHTGHTGHTGHSGHNKLMCGGRANANCVLTHYNPSVHMRLPGYQRARSASSSLFFFLSVLRHRSTCANAKCVLTHLCSTSVSALCVLMHSCAFLTGTADKQHTHRGKDGLGYPRAGLRSGIVRTCMNHADKLNKCAADTRIVTCLQKAQE